MSDHPVTFRVHVNPEKCQGHVRCYALAPELFDLDDLGHGIERDDGVVPATWVDKAWEAMANCPEHAIEVKEIR